MPFHLSHHKGKVLVVGPFKGKPGHTYGTHASMADARQQQKALYANTKDASALGSATKLVLPDLPAESPSKFKPTNALYPKLGSSNGVWAIEYLTTRGAVEE